jgi:hypothetical protein
VAVVDRWSDIQALFLPGRSFDPSTGVASFEYELRGATRSLTFTETVTLPVPNSRDSGTWDPATWDPATWDPATIDGIHRVLDLLYVAASTSYYKIAAPPRVELGAARLAEGAMPWVGALFRQGLGEFAYRNGLPQVLDLEIVGEPGVGPSNVTDRLVDGRAPVVCVGGGKDSIVSIEALKMADLRPAVFAVNPNPIIQSVLSVSGQPVVAARRTLDPRLFAVNAEGAYNGHIPVTAINSLIAVASAVLGGYGPVVMSNERSASAPNLSWRGRDINHQWSKGLEAEALLRDALLAHAGMANAYFSLLRGMSELHIASLFARVEAYDAVVTSCNAAFRITDASSRWCGDCDKCRFVFLALAPFTARRRLVDIFAKDMLSDTTQLPGYEQLCGISAHKPFECVGETDECLVALRLLTEDPEWSDAPVVRLLRAAVPVGDWPTDALCASVLRGDAPTFVPPAYGRALAALAEPVLPNGALTESTMDDSDGLVRD